MPSEIFLKVLSFSILHFLVCIKFFSTQGNVNRTLLYCYTGITFQVFSVLLLSNWFPC